MAPHTRGVDGPIQAAGADGEAVQRRPRSRVHSAALTGFGVCLFVVIGIWLWASSNLGHPVFPFAFAALLLFGMGIWWLVLLVEAIAGRQRPAILVLITPLVVAPLVALGVTPVPMKARWLLTEPAFDAIVEQAGPPTARPVNPNDEEDGWSDLHPCPSIIGSYVVQECSQFPGGYLFWDSAGSGMIDDGGVAYLPNGVPDDAGTGWFESPQFTHLHGNWYAFASSW